MICPNCSSNIPDGSAICPACRVNLTMASNDFEVTGTYCASCGSLVDPGSLLCPSCGMPMIERKERGPRRSMVDPPELDDIDEPEDVESSAEQTHTMARIKSAIPTTDESATRKAERMPAARTTFVAMLAALALVGGLALVVTHPWDPNAFKIAPTEGIDTSQAGFPGQIDSLAGQDSDPNAESQIISGDDATFAEVLDAYEQLGEFASALDDSEGQLVDGLPSLDGAGRETAHDKAVQLGLDISNFIAGLDKIDVTSGTYAEDVENLMTLANWLRNRSDVLTESWRRAAESANPADDAAYIMGPVEGSKNNGNVDAYKALFDKNYERWSPKRR